MTAYALHVDSNRIAIGEVTGNQYAATLYNGFVGYFNDVMSAAR